jgi:malonyl-CoA decarboxylase
MEMIPQTPPSGAPSDPQGNWLERLWRSIADRARGGPAAGAPTAGERMRLLAEALLSERGEASGAMIAQELMALLAVAGTEERRGFLAYAAAGFTPDEGKLRKAAEAWLAAPSPGHAAALADACEPPRQELLRRMNTAPGATAALVELRRELLSLLHDNPALKPLEADLRHLFASWFNRGFLELRRIDWQTPAAVLEKLIEYEAVHEIAGWPDLRRRLAPDRRCFAFFHPALPGEPLIFVEVALVSGLAGAIAPLLHGEPDEAGARARAAAADTAIFYSISNCQEGLRGISFGNFLIKQVVGELTAELPRVKRFATLSPVPGFRRWLERTPQALGANPEYGAAVAALHSEGPPPEPAALAALRAPLLQACAAYLTRSPSAGARIDPVARFHLGNGARLERINWLGNTTPRGLRESYGIMVNYLYDLGAIEANHEAFVQEGAVARSNEVDLLLRPAPQRRG